MNLRVDNSNAEVSIDTKTRIYSFIGGWNIEIDTFYNVLSLEKDSAITNVCSSVRPSVW